MKNKISKVERTTKGLVEALFDEIDLINDGKSTPQQAQAKAKVAQTIINTARLEMDFARFVAATNSEADKLKKLLLT